MRGLKRLTVITRVMVRHGLGDLLEHILGKGEKREKGTRARDFFFKSGFPSPRRIRLALEELGPSFIKLGQLMSTRADLFPPEYIEEFKKLQDRVPPVPFPEIKQVIEEELGRPLPEVFETFDPEPLAAASVAQVHLARLAGGEKLAVKVIRPGIDRKIRQDIRLMYYLAEKIEKRFELGRLLGGTNLVKEFERVIFKELDMYIEAGSIEKFAGNFKQSAEIHIPRVFWEYTTRSVLVMEHIEGIKMDRVEEIRARGIDPQEIANIGLRSFSRQLMEFGFFHADPHPGNTIVMSDGRVALVDFGITGYLDEQAMHQIANIFLGYAEHDYDLVLEALLDAGLISDQTVDLKDFMIDLKEMSEPFYGRSLKTISVRDVHDQIMRLIFKYHIRLPRNLLLLLKTFIQTEALGKILGSEASLLEAARPYARRLLESDLEAGRILQKFAKEVRVTSGYLRKMPRYAHDILLQASQGKAGWELRHRGLESLGGLFTGGINRLTIGLIISASLIAGAMVLNSGQAVIEVPVNLFGLKTISLTALLGLTGYILATILGLWLIISIFRSGKK